MPEKGWLQRSATEWTEEALNDLVGFEEGLFLEFKKASEFLQDANLSRDKLKREIAETVSAFLNSAGGVLLIGVQTEQDNEDRKLERLKPTIDWNQEESLENLGTLLTASSIRDIVHGNVMPSPPGVEVRTLKIALNGGAVPVHVVTVPPSTIGAHQSIPAHRYYKRLADGDHPMLDHEIRDVNSRRAGPALVAVLYMKGRDSDALQLGSGMDSSAIIAEQNTGTDPSSGAQVSYFQVVLVVMVRNIGRGSAHAARIDLGVPDGWSETNASRILITRDSPAPSPANLRPNHLMGDLQGIEANIVFRQSEESTAPIKDRDTGFLQQRVDWWTAYYQPEPNYSQPLWGMVQEPIHISNITMLQTKAASTTVDFWIPWRILADEMPEMRGASRLEQTASKFTLSNFSVDDVSWASTKEPVRLKGLREQMGLG